ncbi:MAG: 50S ribosomal protein L10 [Promethearchaeota archaeon]
MSISAQKKEVPEAKLREVDQLAKYIEDYDVVGLVKMEELSVKQVQDIRKKLRGEAIIRMAKNRLMKRAIEKTKGSKKNIEKLMDKIEGTTAFLFINKDPFEIARFLNKNKTKAPAKPGNIPSQDIVIPEGNTGFPPGPMITELGDLGLKTKIKSGTIWIAEDKVMVKKGEEVPRKVALILSKLGVTPMEVGLTLHAAYQDGAIFTSGDLITDIERIFDQIRMAYAEAMNLSVSMAYPTSDNVSILLQKASMEINNLSANAQLFIPGLIERSLSRAEAEANALYGLVYKESA